MADVFATLAWVFGTWLLFLAALTWFTVRRLRRANRVAPGATSTPPLSWLVSPSRPARLHRRLRNLATWVDHHAASGHTDAWSAIAAEIIATDARLIAASKAGDRARPGELGTIERDVARLEDLALRLRNLERSTRPDRPAPPSDSLEVLSHRIEHLEAAHADLDDLEQSLAIGGPGRDDDALGGTPGPTSWR